MVSVGEETRPCFRIVILGSESQSANTLMSGEAFCAFTTGLVSVKAIIFRKGSRITYSSRNKIAYLFIRQSYNA